MPIPVHFRLLRYALFGVWATCCTAAEAETLSEAVRRAVQAFPEVRAAAANHRAVEQNVAEARGELFPSVDANLGQGRELSDNPVSRSRGDPSTLTRREAGITFSQLLFDGGAAIGQVRRFEARTGGAAAQVANAAESAGVRAALAYLDVLRLRGLLQLAADNVKRHEDTLQQVALLADSGRGRRSDAQQADARLALARSSLSQLRGQLAQAEAAYRHVTGGWAAELADPGAFADKLPATVDAAVDELLAVNPAVRAAEKDLLAARADRDSARARMMVPRVTLDAEASHNHDLGGVPGLYSDRRAMVNVHVPIFRGGADQARVGEAEARIDEAVANLGKVRNDAERDLRLAWDVLREDRNRLPQLTRYASTSAFVVDAYRSQFLIGQRSLLDVLNAENELYSAKSSLLTTANAVTGGEVRVLGTMGKLLQALGIDTEPVGAIDAGKGSRK